MECSHRPRTNRSAMAERRAEPRVRWKRVARQFRRRRGRTSNSIWKEVSPHGVELQGAVIDPRSLVASGDAAGVVGTEFGKPRAHRCHPVRFWSVAVIGARSSRETNTRPIQNRQAGSHTWSARRDRKGYRRFRWLVNGAGRSSSSCRSLFGRIIRHIRCFGHFHRIRLEVAGSAGVADLNRSLAAMLARLALATS